MINYIKPARAYTFLSVILFLLLSGCTNRPVEATPSAEPTRDPNAEQTIEQQLQKIDSAAIPVYQEATDALDKGDYEKSKGLYEQVIVLAPEFSTAYRRLGYIELSL